MTEKGHRYVLLCGDVRELAAHFTDDGVEHARRRCSEGRGHRILI